VRSITCIFSTYSGYYVAGFEQCHPTYRCGAYIGKGREGKEEEESKGRWRGVLVETNRKEKRMKSMKKSSREGKKRWRGEESK
jgi:hypothetical protein